MALADSSYINLGSLHSDCGAVPWYWRALARGAAAMVAAGYLISPALYDTDPRLRVGSALLSALVVALLTAGYSLTALLCFACRDAAFQAALVFGPALLASGLGLLTVAYCFASSSRFHVNLAAIIAIVLPIVALLVYSLLLLLARRRLRAAAAAAVAASPRQPYHDATPLARSPSSFTSYSSWTARSSKPTTLVPPRSPEPASSPPTLTPTRSPASAATEDERIAAQMARLLHQADARPSPDAASATFRIDLPTHGAGPANAQYAAQYGAHTLPPPPISRSRSDATELPDADRGRLAVRPVSVGGLAGRALNREQRRREIELAGLR